MLLKLTTEEGREGREGKEEHRTAAVYVEIYAYIRKGRNTNRSRREYKKPGIHP